MKIDNSTIRLIYAYSDNDPPGEDPEYHDYDKRGSKSVLLLQPHLPLNVDKTELLHWDILSPNFEITDEYASVYWCKIYKSPELDAKHHIVLVEPLIEPSNEEFVHHVLVYECVGGTSDEFESLVSEPGHICYHPNMPDSMRKCDGVFLAWGVGGGDTVLPEHVGIPLEPSPSSYFMLEIHYDNPQLKSGIKDSSGLRLYYTPKLREFDAGALMLGTTVNQRLIIPPGQKEYTIAGHSTPDCLSSVMPKKGIKVLGVFLHAHLLGRRLKVRHFRNNVELAPLADDSNYDFNYQAYHHYSKEITVLPDDQITVECTYDSTKRNETTFGGLSTQEEMCLAFLLHYPKLKRYGSLSAPSVTSLNEILINPLKHPELSKKDIHDGVVKMVLTNEAWNQLDVVETGEKLRNSTHSVYCYFGNGNKLSVKGYISYPENLKPYKVPTSCSDQELPHLDEHVVVASATEKLLNHFLIFICFLTYFSFSL
ncbi:DBH-like monooxygenase protein 1 isoform X2 [Uloborus diversus]|nr:DBH-like monooxygenase protein 1 isoform X2 [Uloborus diversus]